MLNVSAPGTLCLLDPDATVQMTESLNLNLYSTVLAVSVPQLAEPPFQKSPLRFLLSEIKGSLVRAASFCSLSQSAAKVSPRRMGQVIASQVTSREDRIDQFQAG